MSYGWDGPVEDGPVGSAPDNIRILPPLPGQTVLACRCGRALDLRHMWRAIPSRETAQSSTVIHRITCGNCAAQA